MKTKMTALLPLVFAAGLAAAGTGSACGRDCPDVKMPEFKLSEDAGSDVLVLDAGGRASTGKFRVLDSDEGQGAGAWKRADAKFLACASTAKLEIGAADVTVTIDCPVPDGMEVQRKPESMWTGDLVEFFIRPSLADRSFFHYAANADGQVFARHMLATGSSDRSFKSAFRHEIEFIGGGFRATLRIPRGEVFGRPLTAGDAFAVNFTRSGKTCGGLSTWAAVGRSFNEPDLFGRVVFGGAKGYFDRLLAEKRAEAGRLSLSDGQRAALEAAFAKAEKAVAVHGGNAAAFAALEAYFAVLDRLCLQVSVGGRNLLLYRPDDPWGNDIVPTRRTRPLDAIRIAVPLNAKTYFALGVANFADRRFVGRFKVFDGEPGKKFYDEGTSGAARHFTFHETIPMPSAGGKDILDLVSPLPINGLVRLGPRENALLWLEFDSRGLKPGVHRAKLVAKPALKEYRTETVPVEIDVRDMDMDSVEVDRMEYTLIQYRGETNPNMLKFLSDRRVNVFSMNTPGYKGFKICPKFKDGKLVHGDMADFDRQMETFMASGIPRERVKLIIYLALEYDWNSILLPDGSAMAKAGSPEWKTWLETLVKDVTAHAQAKYGIGKDRILWYPVDEPDGPIDDPSFKSKMSRAYHAGRIIKAIDPEIRTFTNPHPYLKRDEFLKDMEKLATCYDTIEYCRQFFKPESVELTRRLGIREVWTYSILDKSVAPSVYRSALWQNMRDGFSAFTPFWHYEESAGGDMVDPNDGGSNVTDYGITYADYDHDCILPSRRLIAHDLAWEDARLIRFLRLRFAGDGAALARIDEIIRQAADKSSMDSMDRARQALLDLVSPTSCTERTNLL